MSEAPPDHRRYSIGVWVFGRGLGVTLLCAFGSAWWQLEGLIGDRGLAPARELIERIHASGSMSFARAPTLAYWDGSSGTLHAICAAGTLASFLLAAGLVPRAALLVAWACYLSIVNVGHPFMLFQWDALLLETCIVATPLVPFAWWDRHGHRREPPAIARWLIYFLLFRLMFRSGLVKIWSGDELWSTLAALEVHYETQPLPTALGWWAHQLPEGLLTLQCAAMFAIELIVPFALALPHRVPRILAAAAFVTLMLAIAATGNYGYFNLLTIVLCLPLLDDAFLRAALPARMNERFNRHHPPARRPPGRWHRLHHVRTTAAVGLLLLGALGFIRGLGPRGGHPIDAVLEPVTGFRLTHDYGLFAVMTCLRPEILIEGSLDGREWRAYEFRFKPGALDRAPVWSAPHMPRLDWQMWFAALGNYRQNPWLVRLQQRLLDGEPAVLDLLGDDPFDGQRPRYVRATLVRYEMTDVATWRAEGHWWAEGDRHPYTPVLAGQR